MAGINLRNPNFESVKVLAPTAKYTAGQMVAVGSLVGVITEAADLGIATTLVYRAEKIVVAKATGVTFAVGAKVYFDATAAKVTSVASGNVLCGRALEAAGSAVTAVEIKLNGDVAA